MGLHRVRTAAALAVLILSGGCFRYVTDERPLSDTECSPEPQRAELLQQEQDWAQASTIHGRVLGVGLAHGGEQPLTGALIAIPHLRRGVQADTLGRFRLDSVPPGRYLLTTRRIGFGMRRDSVAVVPGAGVRVQIALEPQALDAGCGYAVVVGRRRVWRWPWQ